MGDVLVLEAAHDVHDGVHFADMGEELIAEALAAARTLHEARDIDEFDDGGGHLLARIEGGKLVEPLIGHGDDAHVGLDGAERVICHLGARVRDGVEEGGFSHVGEPHDT